MHIMSIIFELTKFSVDIHQKMVLSSLLKDIETKLIYASILSIVLFYIYTMFKSTPSILFCSRMGLCAFYDDDLVYVALALNEYVFYRNHLIGALHAD